MDKPILRITPKKYTEDTTIISMRIPRDMLRVFDNIASATGRTRNEVLSMSLEFALNHMEITENKPKEEHP